MNITIEVMISHHFSKFRSAATASAEGKSAGFETDGP
ncbi:hypothetical protein SDC9_181513 [bioreactor metagenome]|uniref:Uncharacterized protein n=1 Tax=bioreactor metagenome TaxID=1076179 RepID=A0A645H4S1_9ZZZZ